MSRHHSYDSVKRVTSKGKIVKVAPFNRMKGVYRCSKPKFKVQLSRLSQSPHNSSVYISMFLVCLLQMV